MMTVPHALILQEISSVLVTLGILEMEWNVQVSATLMQCMLEMLYCDSYIY